MDILFYIVLGGFCLYALIYKLRHKLRNNYKITTK